MRIQKNTIIKTGVRLADQYLILIIFMAVMAAFYVWSPEFFSKSNLQRVFSINIGLFIATLGLLFNVTVGGMDLSLGYQISLITAVLGKMLHAGTAPVITILLALLVGVCCGLINGLCITKFNVPAFALTLGTQTVYKGLAYVIANGRVYNSLPQWFLSITGTSLLHIHSSVWIVTLCAAVTFSIFHFTYLGKHIIAIGENERATKKSGINIKMTKIICYALGGLFYAVAAIVMSSRSGTATTSNGVGREITALAAVFLSYAYFQRSNWQKKNFNIWRLAISVLLVGSIEIEMQYIGWNIFVRYSIIGILLILSLISYGRRSVNCGID